MKKAPSLDGLSDVITHLNFEYKGTDDDGNVGVFNGACPIGAPDKKDFKALKDLKEADAIEWAKANHPVDHMNEVIANQINEKAKPSKIEVDELPWSDAVEPPKE